MEIIIILVVLLAFAYGIYKLAISKNREPAGWILAGVIFGTIPGAAAFLAIATFYPLLYTLDPFNILLFY